VKDLSSNDMTTLSAPAVAEITIEELGLRPTVLAASRTFLLNAETGFTSDGYCHSIMRQEVDIR
jgi:hypothetical protein